MPIVPNFSATQTTGDLGSITLIDSSTGSDGTIVKRRVYLQTAEGTYLVSENNVNDYEDWDNFPVTTTLSLTDIMGTDYALSILVQWLTAANVVVTSKTTLFLFSQFNKSFFYELTQDQASDYNIVNNQNYYDNKAKLWAEIKGAENAIEYGADIYAAQQCLNRASNMRENQSKYF